MYSLCMYYVLCNVTAEKGSPSCCVEEEEHDISPAVTENRRQLR